MLRFIDKILSKVILRMSSDTQSGLHTNV